MIAQNLNVDITMSSRLNPVLHMLPSYWPAASGKFSIRAFVLCRTGQIIKQLIDTSSGLFRIYNVLLLTQIREEPRTDRVQAMKVGRARPKSNQNAYEVSSVSKYNNMANHWVLTSSITALVLVKVLVDPNHPSVTS